MSFLKKIKNAFYEEIPENAEKSNPISSQPQIQPIPPPIILQNKSNVPDNGTFDLKLKEKLNEILLSNKKQSHDYLDFIKTLTALNTVNMSDDDKYRTVFITYSTLNITKESLIQSGEHYLQILNEEEKTFLSDTEEQKRVLIKQPTEKIEDLKKLIQDKNTQIVNLQNEIITCKNEISAMEIKILEDENKINKVNNNFMITLNFLKNEITTNIQKIKNFIQ